MTFAWSDANRWLEGPSSESRPSPRVTERFFREARAAAQLDHRNIVGLHDAGRDSGRCWIAYQYVEGTTLNRYREQAAPRPSRVGHGSSATWPNALDHAHRRGVFHREL